MEIINLISTIVLSFVAVGVSIFNLFVTKKQLYNSTISSQRIEWISTVREHLSKFIFEYLKDNPSKNKLHSIKAHIDLFLNVKNPDHEKLSNVMCKYLEKNNLPIGELVEISQIVFKNSWERMKWEAGFKQSQEKIIQEIIYGKHLNKHF